MNIYIHTQYEKRHRDYLKIKFTNHNLFFNSKNCCPENINEIDILVGYNIPLDWISHRSKLKMILTDSAGYDHYLGLDWKRLTEQGIILANFAGFYNKSVAEDAIAATLMFLRSFPLLWSLQVKHVWNYEKIRMSKKTLHNKHVTLLGYGNIGKEIEKGLSYYNCTINPFTSADFSKQDKTKLLKALEESSILISTLPISENTRNIIDYNCLKLLGETGIVVNVGRGGTIDEEALVKLLNEQRLYAAYLDVTAEEPILQNSRLWKVKNLILGQHGAGGWEYEMEEKILYLESALNYFITQGQAQHPVTLKYLIKKQ